MVHSLNPDGRAAKFMGFRAPAEFVEQVEQWRAERGLTFSAAIRELVSASLQQPDRTERA